MCRGSDPKYDRKLTDTMVVLDDEVVEVDYVVTSPDANHIVSVQRE